MSDDSDGMTNEEFAMTKAWAAYNDYSGDLREACLAYHKAMISLTLGIQFHEPNGTVRLPNDGDL